MFISEIIKKKYIQESINTKRKIDWEEIDKYIEPAWLILASSYENFPEDMAVFYSENERLLSFNCEIIPEQSTRDYVRSYFLKKKESSDTSVSVITSSPDAAYLFGQKKLAEIYENNTSNFKISLYLDRYSVEFLYNINYLNVDCLRRLVEKFTHILGLLVSNIDCSIKEMFSKVETDEAKYVECFHRPSVLSEDKFSTDIISSIEKTTKRFPDKNALISENYEISYEELSEIYTKVARNLVNLGVNPGDRVGVCMENRTNFIISILAVLKAGSSFVPLDAKMPQSRVDYIVNDAVLNIILVDDATSSNNFSTNSVEYSALLSDDDNTIQALDVQNDAEAYVIYTSGSTGLPKGVSISRSSLTYYTSTAVSEYQITNFDKVLQFSSIAFDAMIEEVFPTLLAGASLVLQDSSSSSNISEILEFVFRKEVTMLNFPSSYWKEFIRFNGLKGELSKSVRLVIIGGEAVYFEDLKIWQSSFPETPALVNTYGPTETTVVTTTYHVPKNLHKISCTVGRPIPGSKIYIVDSCNNIAPIGALGEIYIGGPGLAKGYLNMKNNDCFVELFSGKKSLGIFYKSGDFGRFLHDGNIEFVGRFDEQVKIGGYRVNLNEIKLVIDSFSSDISDVKVINIKYEGVRANKIVAMIESTSLKKQEVIFSYLKTKLPYYMLPFIIILDKFPKTVTGKTDIKGLEKIYFDKVEYEYNHQLNAIENRVAKQWSEILKVPIKDKDKPFFEYGGNSVDTIHMLNRINSEFDIKIPHKSFFSKKLSINNMANEISYVTGSHGVINSRYSVDGFERWRTDEASINLGSYKVDAVEPKNECGFSVIITGATGFLGIHILRELMENESISHVYCLVRGDLEKSCVDKVVKASADNFLDVDVHSKKVTVIRSDITKQRFGLSESLYFQLANSASSIIHCAAAVNIQLDYESLKKSNVESVREIIKFSHTGISKKIHHISSLAIFDCYPSLETVNEETSLDSVNGLQGGYAQSKWVAEKLLVNSRIYGTDVKIYRCGRIWGNLKSGQMPKNDLIWKFITGCIDVGYAPNIDISLDIVPACFISKSIVDLAFSKASSYRDYFHFANPNVMFLKDIYTHLEDKNVPLQIIDYSSWVDGVVRKKCKEDPFHPLSSFEFILDSDDHNSWVDTYFRGKDTENSLKCINLTYPTITSQVLDSYLDSTCSVSGLELA